ncbi:hypothetical protein AYI69_g313 [Smittium culicis]|uniref:Uncharacterized protein n=1 Tax=Smittium culicis TaxID=133412 RepID=A0A1R1YTC9_9FUNG|nr:hypothetical protein AYI69_g313 [Smittium culicis]
MPELCVGSFNVILGDSIAENPSKKFYEIKDKLTRSIPKVNLDVLNEATVGKARKISSAKGSDNPHKFLLEAESKALLLFLHFPSLFYPKIIIYLYYLLPFLRINCVLLYDPIKKVLVLEKIEEKIELVSGSGMSLSLRGNNPLSSNPASELALPSKRLSTPKPSAISTNNNLTSTLPSKKARFSSNTPTKIPQSIDNPSTQLSSSFPNHSIASIPKNTPISPEKDEWLDLEADLDAVLSDSAPTEASPPPKDSSLLIHRKSLIDDSDDEDLFEEVLEPKADFKNSNNTTFELTQTKSQSSENSNQNLSELFNDEYSDNENDFEFEEVIPEPISGPIKNDSSTINNFFNSAENDDSFSDLEKEMEQSLI